MSDVTVAQVREVQRAIDTAKHPLSCTIWTAKTCSCEAQARAVLQACEISGPEDAKT